MEDCIFCKVVNGTESSEIVYQDEIAMAFKDIYPKARVHILIVPRTHIPTIADLNEGDEKIVGHLVKIAKDLAYKMQLKGYKLLFNVGKDGGQVIFHIHLHLMSD